MEKTRIFIKDLPKTATQEDLENAFNQYGNIISIDIKKRKKLEPEEQSFFSYVVLESNPRNLRQCFMDFSNGMWCEENITLQVARENFLERLKKEREEAGTSKFPSTGPLENKIYEVNNSHNEPQGIINNNANKRKSKLPISDNTEDNSFPNLPVNSNENNNYVAKKIKNNIELKLNKTVEKESSDVINLKDKKNISVANLKRLESIRSFKKAYQNQKSLVHFALSNIDEATRNKITFEENSEMPPPKKQKRDNSSKSNKLFDDQSDDDLDTVQDDFEIKEKYEGRKGQKLLELQSKYKNDKRFNLDVRFMEDSEEEQDFSITNEQDSGDLSLEEEKKKEYEILEQVLGTKINSRNQTGKKLESLTKSMLRFDPTQPEHSKYELKQEILQNQMKKSKKKKDSEMISNEKQQEEKETPSVSKDVFYKVNENLKESLNQNEGFSLLNMFGTAEEDVSEEKPILLAEKIEKKKHNKLEPTVNPFRYDSSDEEDEIKDIPQQHDIQQEDNSIKVQSGNKRNLWTESFFFVDDDYRLQEGFDFIEKMNFEEKTEFAKLRRDLKEIVKAKVRNNQSKKKPFKRKLGGNKKRKMMRIKKALKK